MILPDFHVCDCDLSDDTVAEYLQSTIIAVDTETMGLLPQRDRLCLVQLCNSEGKVTVVLINNGQKSAPNLKVLMEAEKISKVFHFARFDLAVLNYHLGINVNPVFCTKIASKLARTYSPRHSLKDLVRELEGIEMDKTAQSSDWGDSANLTEVQLNYAASDVRYLVNIQQKLQVILQREERWEIAQKCFRCLPTITQLDLLQYQNIFEH
ncbi:Ribonuclease D related protein [Richelia intracellularis HH01]|uniref:Ribonuclease D related protein n=1 Tax=Richelia intracellularis HH01 TaxID=1165094 RepID=M1X2G3_9NOST|nr:ribonuclease H-like domain-containing protein [Richelia intracellularis]CCH66775.1 Ribonuclease D related protein [Richelia intracellularis HH01]HAE06132.1 ribonuclease D [Richelia sp.]